MAKRRLTNCTNGGPISVHVEDDKVTRIEPLVIDDKDYKSWVISTDDGDYAPPRKVTVPPFVYTERNRLYSENRIKYPMKRVDFDPHGERNPENRGKSGYERISWDEAIDIVAGEIQRIGKEHGPSAVTGMTSSHHNWGIVGYKMGPFARFMEMIDYTPILDNPDSWEGWHWGATHTYGFFWRVGMPEQYDLLEDALKHTEMIVFWSNDPDSTRGIYTGQESVIWRQWLKDKGIETVFIDPFYNYTNAAMDGKWIPVKPGTDTCLAMAIAHVWVEEDTYDKEYVETRTVGFEEFKPYLLGETDGVEKTPEWAEQESGVPARTIRSLARQWASKVTALSAGSRGGEGGACRQAYATEWARMMVLLQAMQGLGKPGVSIWGTTMGAPTNTTLWFPGYGDPQGQMGRSPAADHRPQNATKQRLYRPIVPDAILNPPIKWRGEGFCNKTIEQQFTEFEYPMEDHSPVKMFYRYGGSFIGTMLDTSKWLRMYQSPNLEFVVNQDCWWSGETGFADIILPACTNLEREDVGEWGTPGGQTMHASNGNNHRVIVRMKKCIDPLWESKSDYQIFSMIAERLGRGEEYTEGKTELDWAKRFFEISDLPKHISWEEFDEKGYYVVGLEDDFKSTPALRWFSEGRACDTPDVRNPKRETELADQLGTYTGKIEFASKSLRDNLPDDEERPVVPRYIRAWEGEHSKEAEHYPYLLVSPHPRFTFHTHYDKHSSWLDDIPLHRVKIDGYAWWPVRIHPLDAEKKGVKDGDIVKLFNDRGTVLCAAVITQRIHPGVIHSYASSASYDPIDPGNPDSPDRGGCVNLLTSSRMMSKNVAGMAPNSCMIDIAKWEGEM